VLRRKQVRTALAGIPGEQRRIIELMYFDGLTQRQVSEQLNLPLGTVKSRTLLAMRKLWVALAGASSDRYDRHEAPAR
jgi:RNA polymerase sigma-70 factor (ECF subfamily)